MVSDKQPLLALQQSSSKYVLVIHGGAGTMSREGSTPERQAMYRAALADALRAGHAVLSAGGEAMDAAVAAVTSMENCPLFNSGKGAVFNVAGKNELETSLMLSKPPSSHPEIPASRRGFALTLLAHTRNPSQLVRSFYLSPELVPHAMLAGAAAEELGVSLGHRPVDSSYFYSEARWREHRRGLGLPEEPLPQDPEKDSKESLDQLPKGTVGAVALDVRGCIAAVTSTGGRTNKLVGRVGDTPLMGCGFWAEEWVSTSGWIKETWNRVCGKPRTRAVGISGTGDGDYFIRQATASTIANRVKYGGETLDTASKHGVEDLRRDGGDGGVIGLDQDGTVVMRLNCPGMYRGFIDEDGEPKTAIFADDVPSQM